jgi:hypothetical protein
VGLFILETVLNVRSASWLLACVLLAFQAVANAQWAYKSSATGASVELLPDEARIAVGDRGYKAWFCSSERIYCFKSEVLTFAVPAVERTEKWSEGSDHFTVLGVRRLKHLGNKINVLEIQSSMPTSPIFLYSERMGLVGIAQANHDKSDTLVSVTQCGFPFERVEGGCRLRPLVQ